MSKIPPSRDTPRGIHGAVRVVEGLFGSLNYSVTVIRISRPRLALAELLEISLGNEPFYIALPNIELAVLGQSYRTVYQVSREYKQGPALLPQRELYLTRILFESRLHPSAPSRL